MTIDPSSLFHVSPCLPFSRFDDAKSKFSSFESLTVVWCCKTEFEFCTLFKHASCLNNTIADRFIPVGSRMRFTRESPGDGRHDDINLHKLGPMYDDVEVNLSCFDNRRGDRPPFMWGDVSISATRMSGNVYYVLPTNEFLSLQQQHTFLRVIFE